MFLDRIKKFRSCTWCIDFDVSSSKKVNRMFPFLSCSLSHMELSVPAVLFQQGAVLGILRETQAAFKSLSVSPSTSQGQDFISQLPNQICVVGIHYMLALGALSLPADRGTRCSRDSLRGTGATAPPRSAEMPVWSQESFVPVPVVCQRPAPGLWILHDWSASV